MHIPGVSVYLQCSMCFPLAMYSTGVDAQMPWVVPYGWWLIRAQMEDMNQRRRGEETINLPNGNPLWGAWASRPGAAVAVFICDLPPKNVLRCYLITNRQRRSSGLTPKPHNKLLARGASHRVSGRPVVVVRFPRQRRPNVPMCRRQPPFAHVSSISIVPGNDTQLDVGVIKEVMGMGFIARTAPACREACRNCMFAVGVWGCGQG